MKQHTVYKPYKVPLVYVPIEKRRSRSIYNRIDDAISDYQNHGIKEFTARDMSKLLNMMPNRLGALLRQNDRVEYVRRSMNDSYWIIL